MPLVFWNKIWLFKLPPKVSNFLWRVISNVLPTCGRLVSKGISISHLCPICLEEEETIWHALFSCSVARSTWHLSSISEGVDGLISFEEWWKVLVSQYNSALLEEATTIAWSI